VKALPGNPYTAIQSTVPSPAVGLNHLIHVEITAAVDVKTQVTMSAAAG
jgi:hypothetical protein